MLWVIICIVLTIAFFYWCWCSDHKRFKDIQEKVVRGEDANSDYKSYLRRVQRKIHNGHHKDNLPTRLVNIIEDPLITRENQQEAQIVFHALNEAIFLERTQSNPPLGRFEARVQTDAHNVHDSNFNRELEEQYKQMVTELKPTSRPDLVNFLMDLNDQEVNIFLEKVTYENALFRDMGHEMEIYYNIWHRIHNTSGQQKLDLTEAFIRAAKDCSDGSYVHCTSGRVGRMFSALACIDDTYGSLKTNDYIKKEILEKTSYIYQTIVDDNLNDPKYGEAARSHRERVDNPAYEEEFNKMINDAFIDFVRKDYAHINPILRENILAEILEPLT